MENGESYITSRKHLKQGAYRNPSLVNKRHALYEHAVPNYNVEDQVLNLLKMRGNETLLDVGCGDGKLLMKAASRYPEARFVGIDISKGMFENSQKEVRKGHLPITFEVGDAQELPFAESAFERVTSLHMLYHVVHIESAISEIHRVLARNGMLVLTANSLKSKGKLKLIKLQMARMIHVDQVPDTTLRFNTETGSNLLDKYFSKVSLVLFESRLRLSNPELYLNYLDSTRDFWKPYPDDHKWQKALSFAETLIQKIITEEGHLEEKNLFGAFVAFK